MKKQLIAALVLVAAAIGATTPSWAFQSVQKTTVTAGTFVGGARVARFTLNIRDISNQLVNLPITSSITWSGVQSGQGWTMASRLLVLNSTVTDNNGGIQIYTENTASDASPKFVDPTPSSTTNADSNAAGLLEGLTGTSSKALPMAWTIKSTTRTIEGGTDVTGVGAADPNNGPTTGVFNNKFQWLFVTDRYNTGGIDYDNDGQIVLGDGSIDPGDAAPFIDGAKYQSLVRVGGIHVSQDSRPDPLGMEGRNDGLDSFVYFQANFAEAAAQTPYQTTTLRVEAFIQ